MEVCIMKCKHKQLSGPELPCQINTQSYTQFSAKFGQFESVY